MINTKTISNQALQLVTREVLNTVEGEGVTLSSPSRTAVDLFVTQAILTVLEQYNWTFATKREKLQAQRIYTTDKDKIAGDRYLYTNEYLGWQMMFELPKTFVGHLEIYDRQWFDTIGMDFESKAPLWWTMGNKIYIADASIQQDNLLNVEYVHCKYADITLPASVELCIVYYLAHLIAPVLFGRDSTAKMYYDMFKLKLIDAKAEDSMRRPQAGKVVFGAVQSF